ncbi:MAG: DNA pilot protein [Microviridae sp.]|nr:MAG: DNA pilot protein [Microviridae sp.]
MFGIDDAIIASAGANIVGGLLQNSAQSSAASSQQDFQLAMSSSAYQRAVKDMSAAGLNPMLAYSQGGASTPNGAMPVLGNVGAAASQGMATGAAIAQQRAQTDNIEANTNLLATQAKVLESQALLNNTSANKVEQDRQTAVSALPGVIADAGSKGESYSQQLKINPLELYAKKLGITKAELDEMMSSNSKDFTEQFGKYMPYVDAIGKVGNSAGNALDSLGSIIPMINSFKRFFGGRLPNAK